MQNFPDQAASGQSFKAALAKYVLKRAKLPNWDEDTPARTRRFTVWNFRHQRLVAGDKAPQSARRYIRQG
jgi:hypothetical protein